MPWMLQRTSQPGHVGEGGTCGALPTPFSVFPFPALGAPSQYIRAQLASTSARGSSHGAVTLAWMQTWLSWFLAGLSLTCPWGHGIRCLRTVEWGVALCLWVFLCLLTLCGSCFEWVWWTGLHGCGLSSCSF